MGMELLGEEIIWGKSREGCSMCVQRASATGGPGGCGGSGGGPEASHRQVHTTI